MSVLAVVIVSFSLAAAGIVAPEHQPRRPRMLTDLLYEPRLIVLNSSGRLWVGNVHEIY